MAHGKHAVLEPQPAPLKAPGLYWLLVAGLTICRSGCVVVPFLSLYLVRQQHFSAQDAAQVSAAFGAGWAIGPALAGWLADRIGRRTTLLLTLSGVAAVYLTMPTLDGLTTLTVAAAAVGLLFDAPRPAVLALVADMVPAAARGRAYARLYWASNIGAGVAGGVGALLADAHITTLFYVAATSNTAFAVTVVFCKIGATPAVRPSPGHSTSRRPAVYRDMFRNKPFLALTGLTLLFLCGYQQVLFGLPVAMDRDGLSPSAYGIINLINAVGVVALQPLLQPWTDRRAPLVVCAAGALALAAGMGSNLGAQQSIVGYSLAAIVWTLGEVLYFSSVMTVVESLAPAEARGRYTGVWASTMGISALIAPLVSSTALDLGGTAFMWTTSTAPAAAAALGLIALQRHVDNPPAAVPEPANRDLVPASA